MSDEKQYVLNSTGGQNQVFQEVSFARARALSLSLPPLCAYTSMHTYACAHACTHTHAHSINDRQMKKYKALVEYY